MIIPRYQGGLSSQPINTGRSLGTGIAGAEALTNLSGVVNNVSQKYGALAIELAAKQRDQEIINKTTFAETDIGLLNEDIQQKLLNESDYTVFKSKYKTFFDAGVKKIKKDRFTSGKYFDEYAYKMFEPIQNKLYVDGNIKLNQIINVKRNYETNLAWDEFVNNTLNNIGNATTENELNDLKQDSEIKYKKYIQMGAIDEKTLNNKNLEIINKLNTKFLFIQASVSPDLLTKFTGDYEDEDTNPLEGSSQKIVNGQLVTDWNQIYKNLINVENVFTDIDGNVLTEDNQIFKDYKEYARKQKDDQINFINAELEKQSKDAELKYQREAITIGIKIEDGERLNENEIDFLLRIRNDESLTATQKTRLIKQHEDAIKKDDPVALYKTVEGENIRNLLYFRLNQKIINATREEILISEALNKGYIDIENYNALVLKLKAKKDKIDTYADSAIKKAEDHLKLSLVNKDKLMLISKQINSTNIDDMTISVDEGSFYKAQNNLYRLVEQGLKKGFSVDDMLKNSDSDVYILEQVLLEARKDKSVQKNLQIEETLLAKYNQNLMPTTTSEMLSGLKNYNYEYIDTYSELKESELQDDIIRNVFPAKYGETIDEYIDRRSKSKGQLQFIDESINKD
tara:strand:- start:6923 stop:8803 length:1881 start_codon:yes stop_codon:yes gene_type:complete